MDTFNEPALDMLTVVDGPQSLWSPFSALTHPALILVVLAISLAGAVYWCIQDYKLFKQLGPGGPAYNIFGWMQVTFVVRPFTLAANDTMWTGDFPASGAHKDILFLSFRQGERPQILGVAPQRQFSQCPRPLLSKEVHALFADAAYANPSLLQTRLSSFEKHNAALYVHPALLMSPTATLPESARRSGELGHMHGDTSLHLYFSPADAKMIIEKGWGQRHRMARTQPWWFGHRSHMWGIGPTFLLIYAPRNYGELHVLKTLIKASARYMTGREDVAMP